jgi:hypothetical protein
VLRQKNKEMFGVSSYKVEALADQLAMAPVSRGSSDSNFSGFENVFQVAQATDEQLCLEKFPTPSWSANRKLARNAHLGDRFMISSKPTSGPRHSGLNHCPASARFRFRPFTSDFVGLRDGFNVPFDRAANCH